MASRSVNPGSAPALSPTIGGGAASAAQQQQQPPKQGVSGQCSLDGAAINLNALRDQAKKELIDLLTTGTDNKKPKVLILDPKLAGPLGLVVEVSLLKGLGVDKWYYLSAGRVELPPDAESVFYLVRPQVQYMNYIADQVKGFMERREKRTVTVAFVPRRTIMCEKTLEEQGVYANLKIAEYNMDLIPFDQDVLSLEYPTCFRETYLDGDRTSLFYVARAIVKLQALYGIIPVVRGKGHAAQHVAQLLLRMRHEMRSNEGQVDIPAISQLVLIDRASDLITPMPMMLTYEGLVDENFGIANSAVELPAEMVVDAKAAKDTMPMDKKVKTPLNSNDKILRDIRDLNFSLVGPILNQKAKMIDEYYKQRHQLQQVAQIKEFMTRFSQFQQEHSFLRIHTNIAESLLGTTTDMSFGNRLEAEQNLLADNDEELSELYIQECINKQEPLTKVLRLLCLYSLTHGGLKDKQYQFFTKEIIQTYGYEYLFTLSNLSKIGLFKRIDGKPNFFEKARKDFRLIVDVDERDPADIAYVFSGYAPLSIRMFESVWNYKQPYGPPPYQDDLREGWGLPRGAEELIRSQPGPSFHSYQSPTQATAVGDEGEAMAAKGNQVILVFFVGGITYAEIAALRFLASRAEGRDILIGTTNIINGNTFLTSLYEDLTIARGEASPTPISMPPRKK